MATKSFTATAQREPFRTEIEHLPDGTLSIRQHTQLVVRDENGVEIARGTGYQSVQIDNPEISVDVRTAVTEVSTIATGKLDAADAAKAAADIEATPEP